ncbi:MAG TPA: pyruvate dehydrogenase (acetyl-transferring), homodimeric type, partial [Burkholderiaceae bacterium]|nr:pyruvate dehydrogenase (acetyl-transferring), homodimeric type [Burkholderiaceae bacterium]
MNAPMHLNLWAATPIEVDIDPEETEEWREAFLSLFAAHGPERAAFMLNELQRMASTTNVEWNPRIGTPYVNTIPVDKQPPFPGDLALDEKLGAIMRWNALAMVVRANAAYGELGGHIASYASAADLFEVGFNHFFHARQATPDGHGGDLVFFQPHSAP